MTDVFGTEIAFRLGPGSDERAREVAARLAQASAGCLRQTLFLNDEGAYGVLAEWEHRSDADGFVDRPGVVAVLDRLEEDLGRRPSVHVYRLEATPPRP